MWLEYDLKLLGDATIRGFSKETPQPLYFLNEGMKSFLLPSKQYVASRALSDNKLEIVSLSLEMSYSKLMFF